MSSDLILVAISLVTWGIGEGMFLYFQPIYLQQLGADPILIGSILGGVGLVMAVSYIPAGYLSDRIGRRPLLRIAWLFGMAATWVMVLANSLPFFVVGMVLYGFTSFVVVPLNSYITHARGSWSVGRTLTFISASFSVGFIFGPLAGGWIGETFGLHRTFLAAAVLFLISTVFIFLVHPQPIEKHEVNTRDLYFRDLMNSKYLRYLIMVFFVMFALYLPQPLSQNYLKNQQALDLNQIGQLIAIRSLGIVVFNLLLGRINARLGFLISQICVMGFTFLLWQGTGLPWFFVGYFLLGGYHTARSLAIAQSRSLIQSATMGVGYGMIETAMAAAIVLAPPLAGYLYQQNPIWIYSFSLMLIGAMFLVSLFFSPIRRKDLT